MRRYLPYIAIVWGAAVLIHAFHTGIKGSGSYAAGGYVAVLFAVALVIAGVRGLTKPKRRR
jgi:predicted phage tail protein